MEVVEDEDFLPRNVAPKKKSRILELSDGSEDEDDVRCSPPKNADDDDNEDSNDEDSTDEGIEDTEESAEAELGQ